MARVLASQAGSRGFESHHPLFTESLLDTVLVLDIGTGPNVGSEPDAASALDAESALDAGSTVQPRLFISKANPHREHSVARHVTGRCLV